MSDPTELRVFQPHEWRTLAQQLGGTDAYANETCARGNTSCNTSRARCCGCM